MPDKASWIEKIPEALHVLKVADGPLDRAAVEQLLEVKRSQALKIMQVAGGYPSGKSLMVDPGLLAEYLKSKVDPKILQQEQDRQRRFAHALTGMRQEFIERPYGAKVAIDGWKPKERPQYSLEGVEFGPAMVIVRCPEGAMQLAARMFAVADLMSKDLLEVEEMLRSKQMKLGMAG